MGSWAWRVGHWFYGVFRWTLFVLLYGLRYMDDPIEAMYITPRKVLDGTTISVLMWSLIQISRYERYV